MKELIELIAQSLVDHPEQVSVKERITERAVVYELSVASEDMGKVIGKQGRVAKAIRTVVNAAALKENKRVWVEIV
ncbi:KH domain-containing protein [Paenactinomyces guangxiensis]|uniref:RNA-binding protein KhpA n=1 Tax=Paenactinomyces guangxiensis TaxID=1490290 RepID=A0A7W1WRP3_9BACL|nr:KH domain-containing protein [Paenactinomyces guangxiensis]MBA4494714.1 KH domain-containing protein [Paenactinomyces guangxiensis]MBH8591798.1 KH domain-containing protein [Paenactinomyces guangxiensis]